MEVAASDGEGFGKDELWSWSELEMGGLMCAFSGICCLSVCAVMFSLKFSALKEAFCDCAVDEPLLFFCGKIRSRDVLA